jgi:hypothetical protein
MRLVARLVLNATLIGNDVHVDAQPTPNSVNFSICRACAVSMIVDRRQGIRFIQRSSRG